MPKEEAIDGVVIRANDSGNNNRYLTVLTAERGRMTLLAKGSHSLTGTQAPLCQLFTYGNYEYYRKGEIGILKGGSVNRSFYDLSRDMDRLNLGLYFCEVAYELTDEGEEAGELLRLLLNSLYALLSGKYLPELIKGAFELRIAALSGYAPDLGGCGQCGKNNAERYWLDVMNGALLCEDCLHRRDGVTEPPRDDDLREARVLCPLPAPVRDALLYCLEAPMERLLSFAVKGEENLRRFADAAEIYLLSHLGRGFSSLDYYHTMRAELPAPEKGTAR